jgi:hypothetical protein
MVEADGELSSCAWRGQIAGHTAVLKLLNESLLQMRGKLSRLGFSTTLELNGRIKMAKNKGDHESSKTSSEESGTDKSLRAAHLRDESAQTRDIERMSDKGPDKAEANITDAERDAHRMRTKNEV